MEGRQRTEQGDAESPGHEVWVASQSPAPGEMTEVAKGQFGSPDGGAPSMPATCTVQAAHRDALWKTRTTSLQLGLQGPERRSSYGEPPTLSGCPSLICRNIEIIVSFCFLLVAGGWVPWEVKQKHPCRAQVITALAYTSLCPGQMQVRAVHLLIGLTLMAGQVLPEKKLFLRAY